MAISKKDVQKITNKIEAVSSALSVNKKESFLRKTITIDKNTFDKIVYFKGIRSLDFSSAIRFIVNDFFSKNKFET